MNGISFSELILEKEKLTAKQEKIFDYMLNNPDDCCYMTIRQLSKRVGVTEVSILRMCRNLGFEGYVDFREYFRSRIQEIHAYSKPIPIKSDKENEEYRQQAMLLENMVEYEKRNLDYLYKDLTAEKVFGCAKAILAAKNIALFGHTTSKVLADFFTIRLNYLQMNASSVKLDESHFTKSVLARIDEEDMIILFCFSPYYQPIRNVVRYAEHKHTKILTITDSNNSPAINSTGYNFICNTNTRFFFNSQTATISLINLLTSTIALEMGESLDLIQMEENIVSQFLNMDIRSINDQSAGFLEDGMY